MSIKRRTQIGEDAERNSTKLAVKNTFFARSRRRKYSFLEKIKDFKVLFRKKSKEKTIAAFNWNIKLAGT